MGQIRLSIQSEIYFQSYTFDLKNYNPLEFETANYDVNLFVPVKNKWMAQGVPKSNEAVYPRHQEERGNPATKNHNDSFILAALDRQGTCENGKMSHSTNECLTLSIFSNKQESSKHKTIVLLK